MTFKMFLISVTTIILCPFDVRSQECSLGIGGKDVATIIEIFQLNGEQKIKLEELRTALLEEITTIEGNGRALLEKHPQTTESELVQLAQKYRDLQSKLMEISIGYDKKMLALFNERQYQRYVYLCEEANRKPLTVQSVPE